MMVISFPDFSQLSDKEKKNALAEMKEKLGVGGIVETWGISRSKIYSLLQKYEIPTRTRKSAKSDTSVKRKANRNKENEMKEMLDGSNILKTSSGSSKRKLSNRARKPNDSVSARYDDHDDKKFSIHMDTHGSASVISETLQMILASEKFSGSELHLNMRLEEL